VGLAGVLAAAGLVLAPAGASLGSSAAAASADHLHTPPPVCVNAALPPASNPPRKVCSPWHAQDLWSRGTPSVYTTTFVADRSQPTVVADAAWIRVATTDLALYPGYKGPGVTSLPKGAMMVPLAGRSRLLATFNSGFYESDGAAGFYVNHTLYFPMIVGLATLVRYTNGTVNIIAWTGGARPGPSIMMARQNLALLVAHSAPTPRSATNSLWGLTLHGVPDVWRTAVGVTASGDLIYAAAPAQTAASMAHVMLVLHCVRAMQLDINPEWPIFVTYAAPGAQGPSLFVPNPNQIPGRFLYPSTKDFFAVYSSVKAGAPQPW